MERRSLKTDRMEMSYLYAGEAGKPRLVLVHGNTSSSLFFVEIIENLEDRYEIIAPDLRCFGESEAVPIDATRGLKDHSDDLYALLQALGWEKFFLLGWSMGGGVVMEYAIAHPEQVEGLILEAPMPPYGIGGTYDPDGKKLEPLGIGTGAGGITPERMAWLTDQDRAAAAVLLVASYVSPGFEIPAKYLDGYIDGMLTMKVGEGMYPGDAAYTTEWPGTVAGKTGIVNSMSSAYHDLSAFADIPEHFPVLWMWGTADTIVSDQSFADFAVLGKLGMLPGYPGEDKFPTQPMIQQTRYLLEKYKANGGTYREVVFEGVGHGVHMQEPDRFIAEIDELVSGTE